MRSNRSPLRNWTGDRLTESLMCAGQAAASAHALLQDPGAERHDQPGVLGERDEAVGRDQPLGRVPPADQRLGAARLARRHVDHRLIVDLELLARQRVAQLVLQAVARVDLRGHLRIEEVEAVAAGRFGAIEREVGLLQQLVRVDAVLRRERDADAGADAHLAAVELERLGDQLDDPHGQHDGGLALIRLAALQDGEFVAAEARQHVGLAQRRDAGAAPSP